MTTATRGFTLVEVLVALAIFSVLSIAGMALLTQTLASKQRVAHTAQALRDLQVTRTLLKTDLAQISPRGRRDAYGNREPAIFAGGMQYADQPFLQIVRDGWENPGGMERRSSLQYVHYRIDDGELIRRTRLRLDAAGEAHHRDQVLLQNIEKLDVSFFANGQWRPAWLVRYGSDLVLPDAVAIAIVSADFGAIRHVFLTSGADL